MNCRPGDLAVVVRFPEALGLLGLPVQLASEPPFYVGSDPFWNVAAPVPVVYEVDCVDARGNGIAAGATHTIRAFADSCLRPIRPQSDDGVDEIVLLVGPAPMTLTEIWEAAHG